MREREKAIKATYGGFYFLYFLFREKDIGYIIYLSAIGFRPYGLTFQFLHFTKKIFVLLANER